MAPVFPFVALQYDPSRVDLASVVTQPYDKITPAMQEVYYQASPYNLARIILGRAEPGDDGERNVYSRAAAYLRQWRAEGVLVRRPEPAFYRYAQRFRLPWDPAQERERVGLIALGQIEDYGQGMVFRHEQTLLAPKADRLNLLRATRAHFGQIFMIYSDPERSVERLLAPHGAPEASVTDEYGVAHSLWRFTDPQTLATVTAAMADKKLIIADGHHRYETALTYRNERRAQGTATAACERVMMTLVNMDAEGLCILPGHRLVHSLPNFDGESFLAGARRHFQIEPMASAAGSASLTAWLAAHRNQGTVMVAVTRQGAWALRYLPETGQELMASLPALQRQLDVAVLHRVVLESVLGISEEAVRAQAHVSYYRDAEEAVQRVRQGGGDVALLINPVSAQQVKDIALAGGVMPQKSTDFYPKMLSGLTIYALE